MIKYQRHYELMSRMMMKREKGDINLVKNNKVRREKNKRRHTQNDEEGGKLLLLG